MNRNITIVMIILILAVLAGYLVWLRNTALPPTTVSPIQTTTQEEIDISSATESSEIDLRPTPSLDMEGTTESASRSGKTR